MKLLLIGNSDSVHLRGWADWFVRQGDVVHLITTGESDVRGVEMHHLRRGGGPWNALKRVVQTLRLIKSINPDLMNGHYATGLEVFAASLSGRHPFIVTTYGSDVLVDTEKLWNQWMLNQVIHKADCILIEGDTIRKELLGLGVDDGKMQMYCFGTDTNLFSPNIRGCLKREWNESIIISTRNLRELYHVEDLLWAFSDVVKKHPNTRLVVVGDGPRKDYLIFLSHFLGIFNKVLFTGMVPHEDLPKYLVDADVYVSTSYSDSGLASSTAEAMSCGVPVVVSDVADNEYWCGDWCGDCGMLYPVGSRESLRDALLLLLDGKTLRRELGNNGRNMILGCHEYRKSMQHIDEVYKECLKK